jgi:peptide/nickel transport system substrate-binding protein
LPKRFRVFVLALLILGLAISGCGGSTTTPAATKDAPKETVLRVGWYAKFSSLDSAVHASRWDAMPDVSLYEPLIWEIKANEFKPGLAESWEVNKDMTEITFKLRKGIKLSDGSVFNADLLIGNFDRIKDPKTASLRVGNFDDVKEYKKIDDYTVKVTFKTTYNRIVNHFTGTWCSPNSLEAIKKKGTEYTMNVVAYGPYTVQSPGPDENTLVLLKNKDYKAPDFLTNPTYDKIIFRVIPEETSRIVALEKGEVDMIFRPPNIEVARLEKDAKYQTFKFYSAGLPQGYMPNVTRAPTNEKNVRLAMIYSLDTTELSQLAFFGVNPPAKSALASANYAFWPESKTVYATSIDKAKQLLDEAGWKLNAKTGIREKNGKPLKIRLVTSPGKEHEVAVSKWKTVGFDAVLDSMAYEASVVRMANNDYEVARLGLSSTDPGVLWSAFHSTQITGGSQFNRSRIADKKLDQLLDQGRKDAMTADARKQLFIDIQKYIMENGWWIPSYEDAYVWVVAKNNVANFAMDSQGNPLLLLCKPAK